jgi:hypothetical protein
MRLLLLSAATAILLVAGQSAWAACSNPDSIKYGGLATRELHVRAGHSCRLYVFSYSGFPVTVNAVQITVPPAHGTLHPLKGTREGTRAYTVAYVAAPGFTGHDRFEVNYEWTILRLTQEEIKQLRPNLAAHEIHMSTEYKAEVTVTP